MFTSYPLEQLKSYTLHQSQTFVASLRRRYGRFSGAMLVNIVVTPLKANLPPRPMYNIIADFDLTCCQVAIDLQAWRSASDLIRPSLVMTRQARLDLCANLMGIIPAFTSHPVLMPLTPNYLRDILQWDFAVDQSTMRAISPLDLHAGFQLYKTRKRVRKYSNRLAGNHALQ